MLLVLGRDMQKNGAAGTFDARHVIVTQDQDDIVEVIVAPKSLGAGGVRMADQAIVISVIDRIAPASVLRNSSAGSSA